MQSLNQGHLQISPWWQSLWTPRPGTSPSDESRNWEVLLCQPQDKFVSQTFNTLQIAGTMYYSELPVSNWSLGIWDSNSGYEPLAEEPFKCLSEPKGWKLASLWKLRMWLRCFQWVTLVWGRIQIHLLDLLQISNTSFTCKTSSTVRAFLSSKCRTK